MKKAIPDIVAIVAFILISLVYFFPADLEGRILFQHDSSAAVGAGREMELYREQTGKVTRWTNSLFGGMPTYQMAPSYDSTRPLSFVQRVYRLFLPNYVYLVFTMLLGFYILLRAFGVPVWLSGLGALAWAFSSYFFIIIAAGHIWKFVTLAYIPPTLAGMVLAYRGKVVWGAVLTALFVAMQVMSNHVQMTYYFLFLILFMVIAYGVMAYREGTFKQWVRTSVVLLVAGLIGVATNLPNLYHTYTYSKETMRGPSELVYEGEDAQNTSSGLDRDYITAWSYGIGETWTLLVPNYKGGSSSDLLSESRAAMSESNPRYSQLYNSFPQYFGTQPWTAGPVYVGAFILTLFVVACFVVRGPLKWALVVGTLFSLLLSWGKNFMPLTNLFIDFVPMYNKFRTVSSILVVAEFTIPLLAVLGLWQVVRHPEVIREPWTSGKEKTRWVALAGAVFGVLLGYVTGADDVMVYLALAVAELIHFVLVYRLLSLRWGVLMVGLLHTLLPALAFALTPKWFQSSFLTGTELTALHNAADKNALPANELPNIIDSISTMRAAMVSADAWRSVIIILIGTFLLVCFVRLATKLAKSTARPKLSSAQLYPLYAVVLLCLVDMWMVNKRYLYDNQFVSPVVKQHSFIKSSADKYILQDTTPDYRVLNFTTSTFDENTTSYWHKSVGGYHAAKLRRYQELIDHHIKPEMDATYRAVARAGGRMDSIDSDLFRVLNMLNTRYFIFAGRKGEEPVFNPYAYGNAWFVDEVEWVDNANEEMETLDIERPTQTAVVDKRFMDELSGATTCYKDSASTLTLTSYEPNHLIYESDNAGDGVAVFSEIYYPDGWEATIDGQPVEIARADYVLRAMAVPAGHHIIEMTFDPKSIHVTESIAYAAYVLMLLGVAYALFAQFRKSKSKPA